MYGLDGRRQQFSAYRSPYLSNYAIQNNRLLFAVYAKSTLCALGEVWVGTKIDDFDLKRPLCNMRFLTDENVN